MHLLHAMLDAGFSWSLEVKAIKDVPDTRPGLSYYNKVTTLKVLGPSGEVVTSPLGFSRLDNLSKTMELVLAKHFSTHPVIVQWRKNKGEHPVVLEEHAIECLGELVHTGLRKLADTKVSCITWNVIHQLSTENNILLWKTIEDALTPMFKDGATPLRVDVAEAVKRAVIAISEDMLYAARDKHHHDRRVSPEPFIYQMLNLGCQMTEDAEWQYGWLGFVLKDAKVKKARASKVA